MQPFAGPLLLPSAPSLLAALLLVGASSGASAADWIRAGQTTNSPVWGLRDGLQFALHPGGFTAGAGGPRGLIRLGYPTLPDGRHDLINFIAVEPIVASKKGFSELERSSLDGKNGKIFWTGARATPAVETPHLDPGTVTSLPGSAEELSVTVHVERFENGAIVRLVLAQRSDAPGELRLTVHAEPEIAPIHSCILTATMGNKARARLLFLKDGPVSSLQLYPEYRDKHFAPHRSFTLDRLLRTANGDVLVAVATDEEQPATAAVAGRPSFWDYLGAKVTQYWRRPAAEVLPDLTCVVNARFTYWMSERPIPGGIAFENFELREPFRPGQTFIFGISRKTPLEGTAPSAP